MERLTERIGSVVINVKYATQHETAIHRLAAIEDILGDEYDLDELAEKVQANREGRCVVLDDLTVADLQQMLTVLDCTRYGDGAETYTTGYRNGHRNGRIEILRHVLGINEGDSAEPRPHYGGSRMENNTIPPIYPAEFVERELGIRTDCYNHSCPFRVNDTRSANRCECTACQNRCTGDFSIAWSRTLTDEELEIIERIVNDHERRWSE